MSSALAEARALLQDVTPLPQDCGRLCGGACCSSLPGERTGMLLFPGEEAYYLGKRGYDLLEIGPLLVCSGSCDRADRPLSCRMFPLLPVLREDGVRVAMDARAWAACPLASQGVHGLSGAFVEAVRQAGQILAKDKTQRDFLQRLTREQDELRALQKHFGRKGGPEHV